jgi:hypothetical protein
LMIKRWININAPDQPDIFRALLRQVCRPLDDDAGHINKKGCCGFMVMHLVDFRGT